MLALDFDGVIADALTECAAVTWYADGDEPVEDFSPLTLPGAVDAVPGSFLATFEQVRAYSRTLDDFMVALELHGRAPRVDRGLFEATRRTVGASALAAAAARAERVRAHWRDSQFGPWVGLHEVHPEMRDLLRDTDHTVAVVSAKDPDSITAILAHHGLDSSVAVVIGSCHDKRAALSDLLDRHPAAADEGLTFVDDCLANVVAVGDLPLAARWARWGYHGPEDVTEAERLGIAGLDLSDLPALTRRPHAIPAHR